MRHPHHHLVLCRIAVLLNHDVAAGERPIERPSHLLDADGLLELRDDDGAARELDAHRDAFCPDGAHTCKDDHPRQDDGVPTPFQKVEVSVLENMHG